MGLTGAFCMPEDFIPAGYGTVTPWLISRDSAALIGFLEKAFDAQEIAGSRMLNATGGIDHVEVKIGDSIVMLFDSREAWPDTPGFFRLYLKDADESYRKAIEAGATSVTEVTELFWGDRIGRVRDPLGNVWWLQAHVKDVPMEEMMARMQEPAMVEAMAYVQRSLAEALNRQS
jgi:PhnB protein